MKRLLVAIFIAMPVPLPAQAGTFEISQNSFSSADNIVQVDVVNHPGGGL